MLLSKGSDCFYGSSALQMKCFMQDYLESQPQSERGALFSVVIAGGVKMKLVTIWFCGAQSMAKGTSEDRLAHLSICWRRTPGPPGTACWQQWMTGLAGEREPWGWVGGGVDGDQPSSSSSSFGWEIEVTGRRARSQSLLLLLHFGWSRSELC